MFEIIAWIFGYIIIGFVFCCCFKLMDVHPFAIEHIIEGRGFYDGDNNATLGCIILFWPMFAALWGIVIIIMPIILLTKGLGWIMNKCTLCERKKK